MTTPANPDDLLAFLHQQLENQRFRAGSLKTLAYALPAETGAYLTETADLSLADVDAKRRILAIHGHPYCDWCADGGHEGDDGEPCAHLALLALPFADRPGYRSEWAPA